MPLGEVGPPLRGTMPPGVVAEGLVLEAAGPVREGDPVEVELPRLVELVPDELLPEELLPDEPLLD